MNKQINKERKKEKQKEKEKKLYIIRENCSVVKGEKEEFNVSLILTRIEFEQIN